MIREESLDREGRHLPNLEFALKIDVTKHGEEFRADPKVLPGMPIVGRGKTEDEAKYNLCVNWLYTIAKHYSKPECNRHGGEYVSIILDLLNEDMNKLGKTSIASTLEHKGEEL
jgi:hypothetical protein